MNQNDRDFLDEMMQERMTRIYAAEHRRKNEGSEFASLEERLNHTLALLSEDQVKSVRQYLEYIFEQDAEKEVLFYRSGLLDGFRLCQHIQRLLDSA
ncbi:MAG: hypothetical protein IJ049_02125 [Oscillospiraceae bacterium]|nr:hypothetical protein [Oscillospiraceae bacterium]